MSSWRSPDKQTGQSGYVEAVESLRRVESGAATLMVRIETGSATSLFMQSRSIESDRLLGKRAIDHREAWSRPTFSW